MGTGNAWVLYGGVLAQTMADGALVCHQLPSELRSIEEKSWSIGPFTGIPIRDFGMDPSEDVLVLIENINNAGYVVGFSKVGEYVIHYKNRIILPNNTNIYHRLHLRSLSSGKSHPLALRCPILELPHLKGIDLDHNYSIEVSGNIIVLLIAGAQAQIAIWDWKTNALLCVRLLNTSA